ncbi:MAG: DNA polymerase [Bacteroidales bacterium]
MSKRLYLLDAYALIYRSYYAFIKNPRYTTTGLNTSAIYGFTNTLIDLIEKENPTHIAVVFDPPYPTFRHEIYKEYKANREATPEDIKKSIPFIKDIIKGFKIPVIEVERYEADDVIGSLAKQAEKEGFTTFMMTPDKDYGQLISDKIFMLKPGRGGNEMELVDSKKICEKYMIKNPVQVIDILGLMGDSSDNIPGAPGIGEKTAIKLINEFESIENLYTRIEEIQGKNKEKLTENKELVFLSKELATIKLDVPITIDPEDLSFQLPDEAKLTKLFNELEFKSILQRIFRKETISNQPANPIQGSLFGDNAIEKVQTNLNTISTITHNYELIDDSEKRKKLISELLKQNEICFDTETTGLDPYTSEIVGLSFSFEKHVAYYIPFPQNQEATNAILGEFKSVFENLSILKIGQNIKFDLLVLQQYNIQVTGPYFDTMIAHYILHPDLRHNLNYLAEHYLGYKPVEIEELIGKKGPKQGNMRNVPLDQIKEYAAEDADIALQLKIVFEDTLKKKGLNNLSESIEMPLIPVLAKMESSGINIDTNALIEYSKLLNIELVETENKIYKYAGANFNISSPKQLGDILFEHLKLDPQAKKKKNHQ